MTMNRDYVVKHNLVERYLRDELSDDEVADFEAFYMDDPETLDELEAAQILLSQKKMSGRVRAPGVGPGDSLAASDGTTRAARNPWQWVSGVLAAALILVVVLPSPPPTQPSAAQVIYLDSIRGSNPTVDIRKQGTRQRVVFVMDVGINDGLVEVTIGRGDRVVSTIDLPADALGQIVFTVPGETLAPGSWLITASAADKELRTVELSVSE